MPAHLLIHNLRETSENPAAGMMNFRAGETAVVDSWSVEKTSRVAPGDRLFFFRSAAEPRGVFAASAALPVNLSEFPGWRGTPSVKPGLAVYKAPRGKDPGQMDFYVNARWRMMADPKDGLVLVPFERLRKEAPFSRLFAGKGDAGRASGAPIAEPVADFEIADALYAECEKAFPAVLRKYCTTRP